MSQGTQSWKVKTFSSLLLLLAVALAARVAYDLLAPLIPALVVLIGLFVVFWLFLGRRR